MFTVERSVGRLIEVRVRSLRTSSDAEAFNLAIREAVAEALAVRGVICADHRAIPIYSPEVTDLLVLLFTSVNASIERAGLVVARSNATFSMQIERIVRASGNPRRRVFYETDVMLSWLSEALNEAEVTRARAFLG